MQFVDPALQGRSIAETGRDYLEVTAQPAKESSYIPLLSLDKESMQKLIGLALPQIRQF